jgi:hypothetical protein
MNEMREDLVRELSRSKSNVLGSDEAIFLLIHVIHRKMLEFRRETSNSIALHICYSGTAAPDD